MTGVVLDTSALVAILRDEPARDALLAHLDRHTDRLVSAPTAIELGIVLEARVAGADGTAARLLRDLHAQYIACDEDLTERAIRAWRRFGKGRHAAALNFGDCSRTRWPTAPGIRSSASATTSRAPIWPS